MPLTREEMDCFREQLQEAEAWLKSLDHPTTDVTKLLGNKTLREIRFAFAHVQAGSTHSSRIASDVLGKAVRLPYDLQDAVNCMVNLPEESKGEDYEKHLMALQTMQQRVNESRADGQRVR